MSKSYIESFKPTNVGSPTVVGDPRDGSTFSWAETLAQAEDPFFALAPSMTLGGGSLVEIPGGDKAAFETLLGRAVKSKK